MTAEVREYEEPSEELSAHDSQVIIQEVLHKLLKAALISVVLEDAAVVVEGKHSIFGVPGHVHCLGGIQGFR
ncbi:hypothetical protein E2C01_005864 [Portunus trituberculatus]|uniref:Uncharacterized protein n=1 Tax=Portunus trituberculatus TaxID=210409 RepID=A0A5B7D093_PORTR|nr:hypothetical protein [Portunus trituberculatus]